MYVSSDLSMCPHVIDLLGAGQLCFALPRYVLLCFALLWLHSLREGQHIGKLAVVGCGHVGVGRKRQMGCGFVCLLLDIDLCESVLSARRHYIGIARFFIQELAGAFVYKRIVAAINEQLNAEQRFDYMMRMATATTSFWV